jgi:hypothetical protein
MSSPLPLQWSPLLVSPSSVSLVVSHGSPLVRSTLTVAIDSHDGSAHCPQLVCGPALDPEQLAWIVADVEGWARGESTAWCVESLGGVELVAQGAA